MGSTKKRKKTKNANQNQTLTLDLPNKVLDTIINLLPLKSALQLRLTCKRLNHSVEKYFKRFKMDLCTDKLSLNHLDFISRINLKKITFKRVAKPLKLENQDAPDEERKTLKGHQNFEKPIYNGPSQYWKVGKIQVRSVSVDNPPAPENFSALKSYLLGIGSDDIFNYV